ncbi:MAG: CDP-diacylglycerol--serine O-phosphatidyltransferase [Candidatus Azobacteroides sp.]|nr:CDP-diacylglycerol--serine O-phosphatidyltransferase [Candidatus Azobacteroides sp.]
MRAVTKHIPNFLTCVNLFFGCLACIAAFKGDFWYTFLWVIIGALFDFSDGFAARMLKAYSAMGKELDSLADIITFGMAPAIAVFSFLQLSLFQYEFPYTKYVACIAFLLVIFSALRLAKFNVDERQTSSFIGLPTSANALFWVSLLLGLEKYLLENIYVPIGVILLIIVFSLLMVSEIPMFSLKIKSLSWKENYLQYILIVCMVVLVALFGWGGISLGILIYILLSIINRYKVKSIK